MLITMKRKLISFTLDVLANIVVCLFWTFLFFPKAEIGFNCNKLDNEFFFLFPPLKDIIHSFLYNQQIMGYKLIAAHFCSLFYSVFSKKSYVSTLYILHLLSVFSELLYFN